MKKSLLFSLLTVCTINSALAENIQNMDTPVNWSYSAIFNTIMDLYKDNDTTYSAGYMTAERIFYLYNAENRAVSAKWICENYYTIAQEEGLKVYNCYDVINKIIIAHNNEIRFNKQIKPIDKFKPEDEVYWNPASVTQACVKATNIYEEATIQIASQDADLPEAVATDYANKAFKNCRDIKYNRELYNKPYSINYLLEDCKNLVFRPFWGHTFNDICSKWIDFAIEHHNEHILNTNTITGTVK